MKSGRHDALDHPFDGQPAMMSFTVCIPVYNGSAFLGELLASIAEQDLSGVEVLVSDNASTDETPQILRDWSAKLPLRVIRQPKTLTMPQNFNAVLDAVSTDAYALICHDDYFVSPDALSKARRVLAENPDVSAVYCDLIYVDEHRRLLAQRRFGRSGRFSGEQVGRQTLRMARNCFGIPLAIRREALGDLRYEDDFVYTMDVNLSWAVSRNKPAFHLAEPLIANRYSSTNNTWRLLKKAPQEYIDLTKKYVGEPGPLERVRIGLVCTFTAAQRLVFHLYERARSWTA
jgi:glycosyltransferase involved in cell wall biosynthesis